MKEKKLRRREAGFSLLELVIVVVIVGIITAIAIIGYQAVRKSTGESVAKNRLFALVEAQQEFRVGLGRKRYATLDELRQAQNGSGPLLNSRIAPIDEQGNPKAVDGWLVTEPAPPTPESLQSSFAFQLSPSDTSSGETRTYCVHEDGVVRYIINQPIVRSGHDIGGGGKGGINPSIQVCGRSSTPVEQ